MIHKLAIRREGFRREVTLHAGLNLVVGRQVSATADRKTCNSLGKSSFNQCIDFCLGAKVNRNASQQPKGNLPVHALPDIAISLTFDLFGAPVEVTRHTLAPDDVDVVADVSAWPVGPDSEIRDGERTIYRYRVENWNLVLGAAFFGMSVGAAEDVTHPDPPTYRQLFNYFCRKSFDKPLKPVGEGSKAQIYKSVACLLGLDWSYVSKYDRLDKEGKEAAATTKGVRIKLKDWKTTIAPLRKECAKKEAEIKENKVLLEGFHVDPLFHQYEEDADRVAHELRGIRSRLVSNRRSLESAKASLAKEKAATTADLQRLYEEATVCFPEGVLRSLQDVEQFHRDITDHRREFLNAEIRRLRKAVSADEAEVERLDAEQTRLLNILSTKGALETYEKIREAQDGLIADLSVKRECLIDFDNAQDVASEVKEAKQSLIAETKRQFDGDTTRKDEAEQTYRMITSALYEVPGSLGIEFRDEGRKLGYVFDPTAKGSNGAAVDKMKSFSFDLTLLFRQKDCGHSIDFLIHDGELYVSSDPRQRSSALKLVHEKARQMNVQYITGMNLSAYPSEVIGDAIKLKDVQILELNDGSPEGKLFGLDFEPNVVVEMPEDEQDQPQGT